MSEKPLSIPSTKVDRVFRELAEAAISVCHHDAAETEDGYIYEIRAMEKRFADILKRKLRP